MNEYRKAHSVALYDAGITITSLTDQQQEEDGRYPLATGTPPGSFRIPEGEFAALKSEFKTKQVTMPMGRRQGGSLSFHKTLSSYNESLLAEGSRVKDLLVRVENSQLLSIQVVEEHQHAGEKHTQVKEISYCGFFAIEWAASES